MVRQTSKLHNKCNYVKYGCVLQVNGRRLSKDGVSSRSGMSAREMDRLPLAAPAGHSIQSAEVRECVTFTPARKGRTPVAEGVRGLVPELKANYAAGRKLEKTKEEEGEDEAEAEDAHRDNQGRVRRRFSYTGRHVQVTNQPPIAHPSYVTTPDIACLQDVRHIASEAVVKEGEVHNVGARPGRRRLTLAPRLAFSSKRTASNKMAALSVQVEEKITESNTDCKLLEEEKWC